MKNLDFRPIFKTFVRFLFRPAVSVENQGVYKYHGQRLWYGVF